MRFSRRAWFLAIVYIIVTMLFLMILQPTKPIGRLWDANHDTCVGVTPLLFSGTRFSGGLCTQGPSLLEFPKSGDYTQIVYATSDKNYCLTHVGFGQADFLPCTGKINQNWEKSGRQYIAADSKEGFPPVCLTSQNSLFHGGSAIGVRRCAKGNKSQFWDLELSKDTSSSW